MKEFQKVITEMTSLFKQFTAVEQMKLKALRDNHVAAVEDCMNKEQAMIMNLRGLEKKLAACQEKAGYGGLRFREILDQAPAKEREKLLPLFEAFDQELQKFRNVNEDANEMLKNNLHMINKAMQQSGAYNGDGTRETQARHITDRKA